MQSSKNVCYIPSATHSTGSSHLLLMFVRMACHEVQKAYCSAKAGLSFMTTMLASDALRSRWHRKQRMEALLTEEVIEVQARYEVEDAIQLLAGLRCVPCRPVAVHLCQFCVE